MNHQGMKDTYQKNLKVLREHFPVLADRVEKCVFSGQYKMITAKSGMPLFVRKVDGREVPLNSTYSPEKESDRYIEKLDLKNPRMTVFLGVGAFYNVNSFLKKWEDYFRMLVFIEKDLELFKAVLSVFDFSVLFQQKNVFFIVGEKPQAVFPSLFNYFAGVNNAKILFKAIEIIRHRVLYAQDQEYYDAVWSEFSRTCMEVIKFFGNSPEDSLVGLRHILDNLSTIIENPGMQDLWGKFTDVPAVIVATGPSLDKNKHWLPEVKDKALVFSVDASLKILLEMGFTPDMVTSLERTLLTAKLYRKLENYDLSNCWLAGCPVIVKEIYEQYPGPNIITYRNFRHFQWLGIEKGIMDIGASAANMAFKVADFLGCNPIIMIGQDLAYAPGGDTHAEGMALGKREMTLENPYGGKVEVQGNNGDTVLTQEIWLTFLKQFERDVSESQATCINATEGGAYIYGTQVMSFREAIDQYCQKTYPISQMIRENLHIPDAEEKAAQYNHVRNVLKESIAYLDQTIHTCADALEEVQQLRIDIEKMDEETFIHDQAITQRVLALEEIRKEISRDPLFLNLVMHVVQSYLIKTEIEIMAVPGSVAGKRDRTLQTIYYVYQWFAYLGDMLKVLKTDLTTHQERI